MCPESEVLFFRAPCVGCATSPQPWEGAPSMSAMQHACVDARYYQNMWCSGLKHLGLDSRLWLMMTRYVYLVHSKFFLLS